MGGCGCKCTYAACRIFKSALSARVVHPVSRLLSCVGVCGCEWVGVGVSVLMQRA